MIQGAFRAEDRSRAIGAWSGLGGIAAALGPLVGGPAHRPRLVALDLPHQPAARRPHRVAGADVGARRPATRAPRAASTSPARCSPRSRSAGTTWALTDAGGSATWWAAAVGLVAAVAFVVVERRTRRPDGAARALRRPHLQRRQRDDAPRLRRPRRDPVLPGPPAADRRRLRRPRRPASPPCPITVCMLLLAARGGALGERIGPRHPDDGRSAGDGGRHRSWLLAVGRRRRRGGATCCPASPSSASAWRSWWRR